MPFFAIAGGLAHALSLTHTEYLPHALLIVDSDSGRIAHLTKQATDRTQLVALCTQYGIDQSDIRFLARGEFLSPGFVDTHTHAPQYPNIGTGGQYQLLDWLENVTFPREARFADPVYARKVYEKVARRTLDLGTTTSCYYGSLHLDATKVLADVVHAAGQRAFVGKCNMDRNSPPTYIEPSAEASLNDTVALIDHIRALPHPPSSPISPPPSPPLSLSPLTTTTTTTEVTTTSSSTSSSSTTLDSIPDAESSTATTLIKPITSPALVQPILTPRFAISTTPELLELLSNLVRTEAAKGTPLHIQTHLCENAGEIAFTKELFEKEEARDVMKRCRRHHHATAGQEEEELGRGEWDGTYAGVYHQFGLLTERTVLAHCVHLLPSEIDLLSQTQSGISHCPTSNLNIRSGLAPIGLLLDRHLNVGLGTDCSGGYESGILSQIRAASVVSKLVGMENENKKKKKEKQEKEEEEKGKREGESFEKMTQLPLSALYYLATRGGAHVCQLGDVVGAFEVGMEFDGLLVDLKEERGAVGMWWVDDDDDEEEEEGEGGREGGGGWKDERELKDAFEKWIWGGDDRNLARVWVRGREVGGKDWVPSTTKTKTTMVMV